MASRINLYHVEHYIVRYTEGKEHVLSEGKAYVTTTSSNLSDVMSLVIDSLTVYDRIPNYAIVKFKEIKWMGEAFTK